MSRELLKRALNALHDECVPNTVTNAILIKEIEAELSKPEPEPIGYVLSSGHGDHFRRQITEDLKAFWKPVYLKEGGENV